MTELTPELERILARAVTEGVARSAVAVVVIDGTVIGPAAVGDAVAFADAVAPVRAPVPATSDTVYDLASVTKVVTAITVLALVDDGTMSLDDPVTDTMPAFDVNGRDRVTPRQLLTHTSGLPPTWDGRRTRQRWSRAAMLEQIVGSPLVTEPGTAFSYSCVGFLTLMAVAERLTGQPWPVIVEERVLAPLRSADSAAAGLTFRPDASACAATEYQPELGRGMVRGTVHDETASALGGATGNAGLFGTASALATLGEALRGGLRGILSAASAAELWRDQLGDGVPAPGYGHGLGLRIGQLDWMSEYGAQARGHTGFTGTSLLVDREHRLTVVLLTNRVHPSRHGADVQRLRADVAAAAYRAMGAPRPMSPVGSSPGS